MSRPPLSQVSSRWFLSLLLLTLVLLIRGLLCFTSAAVTPNTQRGVWIPSLFSLRKCFAKSQAPIFVAEHLWSVIFALALPRRVASGNLAILCPSSTGYLLWVSTAIRVSDSRPLVLILLVHLLVKDSNAVFSRNGCEDLTKKPPVITISGCDP